MEFSLRLSDICMDYSKESEIAKSSARICHRNCYSTSFVFDHNSIIKSVVWAVARLQ